MSSTLTVVRPPTAPLPPSREITTSGIGPESTARTLSPPWDGSGREVARRLIAAMIPAYTWLLARNLCEEAQALFRCGIAAAGALCSGPAGMDTCQCGALRRLFLLSLSLKKAHPAMPDPFVVAGAG